MYAESGESGTRHADVRGAPTAIDDGARGNDDNTEAREDFEHFTRTSSGGNDILDDDGAVAGLKGKSAPEHHAASVRIALRKEERHAESTSHFVSNDESTDCRSDDCVHFIGTDVPQSPRQLQPEMLREPGMLENQSGLQVLGAVEAAGEAKVATQVRSGLLENRQRFFRADHM